MELDRRNFLRKCGVLVVATASGNIALNVLTPLGKSALAASLPASGPLPAGTPILVLIDLQGGNDAVNMLINPSDPWYYDVARGHGNIAIQQSTILPLAGTPYGLHPSMAWLAGRWANNGDLAFVQGSGENVKQEFSHFAASYYRNVADFSGSEGRGWLGRYNDIVAPASPFASVSLNGVQPCLIGAQTPVLTIADVASYAFNVDYRWRSGFLGAWQAMGAGGSPGGSMMAAARQNVADSFATQAAVAATNNATYNSTFPPGLGRQLAQAAMLIQAGFPSQTYVAAVSGFDTHGSEAWNHADLLKKLDDALKAFFGVINASPRAKDVFVLVTSEFGRQQTANASAGCDHGQAGVNMLLGGHVGGGLYGQAPLTDPSHRINDALVPTVDFRSVYATVLNRLAGDSGTGSTILGQSFPDLGIFAAPQVPAGGGGGASTTTTSTTAPSGGTTTSTSTSTTMPSGGTTTTTMRK
jgi:uncharacterized protein (DUF1501 family)